MRVSAATDELELPAAASADDGRLRPTRPSDEAASGLTRLRLDRARTVASSLDVRGARVDEALEVARSLPRGSVAGRPRASLTIIHGMGPAPCATPCAPPQRRIRWCAPSAPASGARAGRGHDRQLLTALRPGTSFRDLRRRQGALLGSGSVDGGGPLGERSGSRGRRLGVATGIRSSFGVRTGRPRSGRTGRRRSVEVASVPATAPRRAVEPSPVAPAPRRGTALHLGEIQEARDLLGADAAVLPLAPVASSTAMPYFVLSTLLGDRCPR